MGQYKKIIFTVILVVLSSAVCGMDKQQRKRLPYIAVHLRVKAKKLKKAVTVEKNLLPTEQDLQAERGFKDKMINFVKIQNRRHPRIVKVGGFAILTTAIVGALYKYNNKFKLVVNNFIVEPVLKIREKLRLLQAQN